MSRWEINMSRYRFRTALLAIAAAFLAMVTSTAAASAAPSTTTANNTTTVTIHGVTVTLTSNNGVKLADSVVTTCTPALAEWVHLYTTGGDICIGFVGTAKLGFNDTYDLCTGNNDVPSLSYWPLSNGDIDVTSLTISGWSGHNTCRL
jgi:hypothetical protein